MTLRLFRASISKRVDLRVNLVPDLPPILADVSQIRQLVLNLLTNAWESLPNREGSIGVNTSRVTIDMEDEELRLAKGTYVRLEVTDTGCGIADDARTRIFDPFYTTKSLGRGLGLAAVQGTVRSLRGAIRIESTPGRGSSFQILLPCGDSRAA
jgi:signal transduction histidine kinase